MLAPSKKTTARFPPPAQCSPHRPFYDALLSGKSVLRDDRLNNVKERLTLRSLDGDASQICLYGYLTLSVVDDAIDA